MKEKTADIEGHRVKVDLDQHKPLSSSSSVKVSEASVRSGHKEGSSKNPLLADSSNSNNGGSNSNTNNNFDDDYNEWDISIGDLIIDLDADIERQSEGDKSCTDCPGKSESNKSLPGTSKTLSNSKQFADITDPGSVMSSNLKSNRLSSLSSSGSSCSTHSTISASTNSSLIVCSTNGASSGSAHHHHNHNARSPYGMVASNTSPRNSTSSKASSLVEHHATVDKGLKMKIKRKNIGGKISETKHEIVSSDISPQACKPYLGSFDQNSNPLPNVASNNVSNNSIHGPNSSLSLSNSVITASTEGVKSPLVGDLSALSTAKSSKHSNKNKSAHRDKKEKEKEKIKFDKEKLNLSIPSGSMKMKPSIEDCVDSVAPTSSSQSGIPSLNLKYSTTLSPTVISKPDESQKNMPNITNINNQKKIKTENDENISEKKSVGTTTSISTLTDPECLGPCEPGTSVTLEGIVWQETEGGVLVVNVTWRGKTYVGTLLDCTKHDWAPPRMCDSPTSDIESKSMKNTRGKRARNSFAADNSIDTRSVTSKLRNGKGRRTANSGYVPPSPAKSDSSVNSTKRKGRPSDLDLSSLDDSTKRNRISKPEATEIVPTSPVLIECPEPNCSKKYKHINGLKYHQSHAHMGSTFNINDSQDFDNTNSEPTAPCSSKDEASDSELNDSSMPDFGIKEISNSSDKFRNELKNKLENDSFKADKFFPNTLLNIETKKLNNSANEELVSESNEKEKSSDEKMNATEASEHEENGINCDELAESLVDKSNEKSKPSEVQSMPCDEADTRPSESNRDSANTSRDVILPCDGVDLSSLGKPTCSSKSPIIPQVTGAVTNPNIPSSANNEKEIENVPSPAYSDISDDTNLNESISEPASSQPMDKNDAVDVKKSQTSNFGLSSFPSYFGQSPYITPANVNSKSNESAPKTLNDTSELSTDLASEKCSQNPYPYPFFRFGSMPSHDTPENNAKPNTSIDSRPSLSPNKLDGDSFLKEKAPENSKSTPKESDFGKQPIVELQNLKNRIQNFAFDQGSLYDTQKRFIPESEKDRSKEKPKHSPLQPKLSNTVKEEKEKSISIKIEEGVKPTMETTGPPPPTNGYYYNPSFLPHTFPPISPYDNIFRNSAMNHVVMGSPYGPPPPGPFLHPQMRFPMAGLDGLTLGSAPPRTSTPSSSGGLCTTNTSAKASSHHLSSTNYNSTGKVDRGAILSPTCKPNSIPSSSHSLMSSSAYHKSPSKDFASSHSVSVSSVSEPRPSLTTVSASMHPPRHALHSASHVTYPMFDPYSAMIVNHASNSVPMHPFAPK